MPELCNEKSGRRRRRRSATLAGAACLVAAARAASAAATYTITNDTYIDSEYVTDANGNVLLNNAHTNYGSSAAIKVVTSAASASEPNPSTVRSLFTLPDGFWAAIGTANVSSAVVTYQTRNTVQYTGTRPVELHPLTQPFVAGTGGSASSTMGGTNNSAGSPVGADWYTYNGATSWATPGGDYDATDLVLDTTVTAAGGGITAFSWDLAPLLNVPALRAEIHADGLLMKLTSDGDDPNPQDFASLYSYDGAGTNTAHLPTVSFTTAAVPEPATGSVLVAGVCLAAARTRRKRANKC